MKGDYGKSNNSRNIAKSLHSMALNMVQVIEVLQNVYWGKICIGYL